MESQSPRLYRLVFTLILIATLAASLVYTALDQRGELEKAQRSRWLHAFTESVSLAHASWLVGGKPERVRLASRSMGDIYMSSEGWPVWHDEEAPCLALLQQLAGGELAAVSAREEYHQQRLAVCFYHFDSAPWFNYTIKNGKITSLTEKSRI